MQGCIWLVDWRAALQDKRIKKNKKEKIQRGLNAMTRKFNIMEMKVAILSAAAWISTQWSILMEALCLVSLYWWNDNKKGSEYEQI